MKITDSQRIDRLERQVTALTTLLKMKGYKEPEPQLKQLDQSVFDGLDAKWQFAAVDKNGEVWLSTHKTQPSVSGTHLSPEPKADSKHIKGAYDTTDWQNSLIERDDTAKELLEVDLSSELTGSDLCRKMLERGDKIVTCAVKNYEDDLNSYDAIIAVSSDGRYYESTSNLWSFATPINNQGEPLTAAEAGL